MRSILYKIGFTIFLFVAFQSLVFGQTEFFVSPNGKDENNGSEESPFASLSRAKEVIKAYKVEKPDEEVTLVLKGGTYCLSEPLVFGSKESGSVERPYTIRAAEGERNWIGGAIDNFMS